MARGKRPPPDPERIYGAIYWLLPEAQREAFRELYLSAEWRPPPEPGPLTPKQRLERFREIERFYNLRPGLLEQWPEALIERVEPEGE